MNRSVLRHSAWMILGAVAIAVVVLWMAGVFHTKIPAGIVAVERRLPPTGAATARVDEETVAVVEEAVGTVEAERRTVVSSRILATISAVHVRAGQEVSSGEPLVELDDRDLSAAAEQAQRGVEAAAATRTRRARDFERATRLLREGVMSRSEFETMESAAKVADAELEGARQALEAAQVARSYAVIGAPVGGRVVDRFADPGDTASPGKPLLAIYDPTALRIEAAVRESVARHLAVGDEVGVRLGRGEERITASISEIVPDAETGSRSFRVKVRLPPGEGVFTGMFGRVFIPVGERRALRVPAAAVETVGQLSFVSTVNADGELSRRLVTLGRRIGEEHYEVLSGLRAGEEVVLAARPRSAGTEIGE